MLEVIHSPNLVKYCTGNTENDQDEEEHEDLRVGQLINCRSLRGEKGMF